MASVMDDCKPTLAERWNRRAPSTTPAAEVKPLSAAARDVLAEQERQMAVEGWAPEHDDEHGDGELAIAAECYALHAADGNCRGLWPWDFRWWKPRTPRRDLVKAGALILAELDRIDRAALNAQASERGRNG
jgi:hypothetical protein